MIYPLNSQVSYVLNGSGTASTVYGANNLMYGVGAPPASTYTASISLSHSRLRIRCCFSCGQTQPAHYDGDELFSIFSTASKQVVLFLRFPNDASTLLAQAGHSIVDVMELLAPLGYRVERHWSDNYLLSAREATSSRDQPSSTRTVAKL